MQNATAVFNTQQIRVLEQSAIRDYKIDPFTLMQRAGFASFSYSKKKWPHAKKILVFCGAGNNGGDGYIFAEYAAKNGLAVRVLQIGNHDQLSNVADIAKKKCENANIVMQQFNRDIDLSNYDLIVDAICGIGIQEQLRENVLIAVQTINQSKPPVFCLDIPTGIHADTGAILGDAIHATATITFIGLKLGLLTGSGISHSGTVITADLQLPETLFQSIVPYARKIELSNYDNYIKPRPRDWHKGLSGRVLIVGGMPGMSGAARMAGEAALRVGAGLVSIATHQTHAPFLNVECPELMIHNVSDQDRLPSLIAQADVIAVGPGLGQTDWSREVWEHFIRSEKKLVVDADALNLLAEHPFAYEDWILTPHPGEAARLLNTTTSAIQYNRPTAIAKIQKKYGGICVLKGAGTLILGADGQYAVCDKGNPGMSTAGMGDILTGVIAGLVAQKIPLEDAAALGVLLHASAGDLAAKAGERGLIATDLMPYLHYLCNLHE